MSVAEQEPVQMVPLIASELDVHRGLQVFGIDDLALVDPDQRIELADLSLRLGARIDPQGPQYSDEDGPFGVDVTHMKAAEVRAIERGLYIYRDDPRHNQGPLIVKTRSMAGFGEGVKRVHGKLPFDANYYTHPDVVFPASEYNVIARNATDLLRATDARTRNANSGAPDVEAKARRARIHVVRAFVAKIEAQEDQYAMDHKLATSLYKQARNLRPDIPTRTRYKAKNLDKARKQFDDMLHETVETAAVNNNWGATALSGVHRAIVSNMYRRGSSSDINRAWQQYTKLQGFYINARIVKLLQSKEALKAQESYVFKSAEADAA